MVISDSLGSQPDSREVVFGTYGPFTTLWLNLMTEPLPVHRAVWTTWPYVLSLCGIALLIWASWRLGARWGTVVTGAVVLAASTPVLKTFVAQANHGTTYFSMCVLGAFLVLATTTEGRTPLFLAGAFVVGVLIGVNAASDPLLVLVGAAPFAGALGFAVLCDVGRRNARTVGIGAVTLATTAVAMVVTTAVMSRQGYRTLGVDEAGLASPSQLVDNVTHLGEDVLTATNGNFFADRHGAEVVPSVALAVGTVFLCGLFVRRLAGFITHRRRRPIAPTTLYVAYWTLAAGLLVAGYVVTTQAQLAGESSRYMTPVFLAIAVTVPLLVATTRAQVVLALAAAVFCVVSTLDVVQGQIEYETRVLPAKRVNPALTAVLEERRLTRGYAGYLNAAPITLNNGAEIEVYPVTLCVDGAQPTLCGFYANRISTWYDPEPDTRTFVIIDSRPRGAVTVPIAPPGVLGLPSEVVTVGSLRVLVYPYDVASRFGATL